MPKGKDLTDGRSRVQTGLKGYPSRMYPTCRVTCKGVIRVNAWISPMYGVRKESTRRTRCVDHNLSNGYVRDRLDSSNADR